MSRRKRSSPGKVPVATEPNSWHATVVLAVVQIVVLLAIGTQSIVFGSDAGRWVYPYVADVGVGDVLAAAGLAAVVAIGAWIALRFIHRREALVVGIGLVGLTIANIALLTGRATGLASLVESDVVNGFYSAARHADVRQLMASFTETVQQFTPHVRTNLPGKVLFYVMLLKLSQRTDVIALMIVFASNLSALVVYAIVRQLTKNPGAAFMAMVLAALTPSKVLFLPDLNTVSPLPVLVVLWMFILALEKDSCVLSFGMGVVAFVAFLFEPLPFALGLVGVVLLARHLALADQPTRRTLQVLAAGLVGFGVCYAVFALAVGFDLFRAFDFVLADAVKFNAVARRDYGIWLWQNLKEHLLGMGAASAVVFAGLGVAAFRRPVIAAGSDGAMRALVAGGVLTLVTLDLLGVNRGEVTRLWIFLTPLAQAAVAYACRQQFGAPAYFVIVAGEVMQTALCAATVRFMTV
jgi:hypothetical protein